MTMASDRGQNYPVPPPYSDPRDGVYSYDQPSDGPNFQVSQLNVQNLRPTTMIVGQPGIQGSFEYISPPPNYLVLAILSTIFCFFPTGVCAIVSAVNSSNAAARGDMQGARVSSDNARNLSVTSIVVGFLVITLYTVYLVVIYPKTNQY